jgi:hypothetical protein
VKADRSAVCLFVAFVLAISGCVSPTPYPGDPGVTYDPSAVSPVCLQPAPGEAIPACTPTPRYGR